MNETIVNSVRSSCKVEHIQRSFKCVINHTQCIVRRMLFKGDCGLNQYLIHSKCQGVMLRLDPNVVLPDHFLPNNRNKSVAKTGLYNYHSTLQGSH